MPELDPAILNLLEDIEIALILAERSGGGPDVPLAEIAARLGIDLDNLWSRSLFSGRGGRLERGTEVRRTSDGTRHWLGTRMGAGTWTM